MQNIIDDLPVICSKEKTSSKLGLFKKDIYSSVSDIYFDRVRSSFGIALHMHQPTILSNPDDLQNSFFISNIQSMLEHQGVGDNHNAPVFMQCYRRISQFIRDLVNTGCSPRVMLDYSGNLLWGLSQVENGEVLEDLKLVTKNKKYYHNVEWLGTMWSHAVVPSTPVPDIALHIKAWQNQFSAIFGKEALSRVKGFSPPEMHLPIHPDICYHYVKTLKECGYQWLMVQEHTIENLDGSSIQRPHFPHKLVAKNSLGQTEEISILIKTQGSDTKLVAQMQPYYEAQSLQRQDNQGKNVPPFVLQISDGENGGVMMNEFPSKYLSVMKEVGSNGVFALNGSEYLEFIKKSGLKEKDFIPVQSVSQSKIWEFIGNYGPKAVDQAIDEARKKYGGFNLDKGSWTSDKDWVKGYEDVLDPINKLSVEFHRYFDGKKNNQSSSAYQEALLYLLLSQTSCFRYWGSGLWTEYAKEICRRGFAILKKS